MKWIPVFWRNNVLHCTASLFWLAVLVFSACTSNSAEEIKALAENQDLPSLRVKNLETTVTDSGRVKYRLITPELIQYDRKEEPYVDFPTGLHFLNYTPENQISSQIKCNNARYFSKKELWELNNDVEAINEKGDILNTEQLFWDTQKHKIYSEKFVKITTSDQMITGYGFEANEDLSWYEIKKPSGEIAVSEQP